MSDLPDLTSDGYQIDTELGRNREGGRITWKGREIKTQKAVVIKQFCFAQAGSSWSGYRAYNQEIVVLQQLNHPNIPRYLNSFETNNGFCLIQEYINATSCDIFRPLTTVEIRQVAQKLLDILIYLQQQTPPILHRDLSPANILLDQSLNVYLIDFGFSCLENQEVADSSVFQGTPGFIAPEQIIQPTMASDIYGLGVSLVCLLAHQSIAEVRLVASPDDPYQLDLDKLLFNIEDKQFLSWLKKMTNARVSQRFANALSAKNALLEINALDDFGEDVILAANFPLNRYIKPKILGGVGISAVTAIATWGIGFVSNRVELTILKGAIAIVAALAIAVTQLGAVTIVSSDSQAKAQGIALGMIIPTLLVSASGLIWGMEEVIVIASAIAIGEILLLSYCWGQLPSRKPHNSLTKGTWWVAQIAIGIILGLQVI